MENKEHNENIKYQNILLSPNNKEYYGDYSMKKFDEIVSIQNDNHHTSGKPWSKLDKITKIKKLEQYIKDYVEENHLSKLKEQQLYKYLRECLDRKKLQRIKDVSYDKDQDKIIDIPGLTYNSIAQKFTLKVKEKKDSTLKNLTKIKKVRRSSKSPNNLKSQTKAMEKEL